MTDNRFELRVIGHVESPLTDPATAAKQGHEGGAAAWLVFADGVEQLADIEPGGALTLLTWLDRAWPRCP